jgi:NitT/TauT family transport system substrate-binding protein
VNRRLRALLCVLLPLAVLATACGDDDDGGDEGATGEGEGDGSGSGEELTPITVGILPLAGLAPLYYGVEHGYFEEEGLEVTMDVGGSGAELAPSVLDGEYQFAVGEYMSIMQARENDVPVQVVSNLTNGADAADDGINALLVSPDSGIDSPDDLAGKVVAVNGLGGIEEVAIRAIVDDAGADSSTVEFTEVGFPEMNAAVEGGDVDVAAQPEPFVTMGEEAGLVNLLDPFYEAVPGMPLGLFFGSEEWLNENPEVANAFYRALQRSIEAASDVEAMKEAIVAETEMAPDLVDQIALDHWVGEIDRDKVADVGRLAAEYGVLQEEPDVDAMIWMPEE